MNSINFVNRHSISDQEIGVGDPDTVDDEADGGPIRGDMDVAEFADEDDVVGEEGVEEGGGVRRAGLPTSKLEKKRHIALLRSRFLLSLMSAVDLPYLSQTSTMLGYCP
ncbi:hypothetical protein SASPL_141613 [Salvia splendens]|uniref:Uncharacterized protein n=1 Tax=Salvia splendens TaxID=180675 RepID=A0A8X8WQV7_SALSN|nr:hypothetical protein SASPL_141613 [Salvia splendens]